MTIEKTTERKWEGQDDNSDEGGWKNKSSNKKTIILFLLKSR